MPKHLTHAEEPRKVVVLGANGFLGAAMTHHLAEAGHEVTAYCRQPTRYTSAPSNIRLVTADLRDTWILTDVLQDADVVYHFASSTHPSLFFTDPSAEYSEALQPLMVVMEIAARANVKKIVFPSSGGTIYADSDSPRSEDSPTDPRSPYAIFKLAAEHLLHHAARLGHFSVDVFRIGNPYGPGQLARPGQGVIPHWIHAIQSGQPLTLFGDGSSERDFVFVDDVCRLMCLSLSRLEESDTFNLGSGVATSLSKLFSCLQSVLSRPLEVTYVPGRLSDARSVALSPSRILKIVPDFQFTSLAEGLRRILLHNQIL